MVAPAFIPGVLLWISKMLKGCPSCALYALPLLSFLSKSFSRHSFSYARVKISECATGATVHYTQVSTRDNRPCMRAVCQIISRYVSRQICLISSNLKYRKMLSKGGDRPLFSRPAHTKRR